jgi:glutamate/tyrosine decarboxylase-like PLP-dependent enzyme
MLPHMQAPDDDNRPPRLRLPEQGLPRQQVLDDLSRLRRGDARWEQGRTFSLVYHAGDEHTEFLKRAHNLYFSENALNPGAFRSLLRLENEAVAMTGAMLHGDEHTAGTLTSGGSESIFMAVKTYRDRARAQHPEIAQPEMVLPTTVHPAFNKAGHYLGVRPVHVPLGPDFRVDVEAVRRAIGPSTVLVVGSAPAYPHGVIDPIAELAGIAHERGLGMHVDACLGGFLLPFVERLGHPIPPFDFRVPGVTSMSADLHKYGFAAKGASAILYRDKELRRYQFFVHTDWPGGLFGSTTAAGTRPGGSIAAAWAALVAMGEDGYLRTADLIMKTTRAFQEGIAKIPGLRIVGKPAMSVFAFAADAVDIFVVADAMEGRGWHIDRLQDPAAIHLMITPAHVQAVDAYLGDLRSSVDYAAAHPEAAGQGAAAMYGMLAHVPDRGMIRDYVLQHIDDLYRA